MSNKKRPYMFCKAVVRRKGPLSPALPKAPQELLVPAGLYGGHELFESLRRNTPGVPDDCNKKTASRFRETVVRRKGLEPPTF